MDISVPISELRDNLKQYLAAVTEGKTVLITKRGKVIARIEPEVVDDDKAYKKRLKAYKNGGISIQDNIIDQPLKEFDYLDDSLYNNPSIAAEPND